MNIFYSKGVEQEWFYKEPTEAQIRLIDEIVSVMPELKDKRKECTTRGKASSFITSYKPKYLAIKKERIAMLEEDNWNNIFYND